MKILLITLARLGDIYLTWPAIRGLRRKYPDAEIHVLSRPRFQAAYDGLNEVNRVIAMPSSEILSPLLGADFDIKGSLAQIENMVSGLRAEKYDTIVNWSFSPVSSYLANQLKTKTNKVLGYVRHADGFLSIPDDTSAYFYAQVGPGRANRFHLSELFASMLEIDLMKSDWAPPSGMKKSAEEIPVLVHIGASENQKSISTEKWTNIINSYLKIKTDRVALIGSPEEIGKAEAICASTPGDRVINLVGKTKLSDLMGVIASAKVLIGADSAPIHMASLVGTRVCNISLGNVNFWETGPRAEGSVVLRLKNEDDWGSDRIALALARLRDNERQETGVITVQPGSPGYFALTSKESDFQWNLLEAIYLGKAFPYPETQTFIDGLYQLREMNTVLVEQLTFVKNGAPLEKLSGILARGEEVIEAIGKLVPSLDILIRWYQTEKVRMAPGEASVILDQTMALHERLQQVLELYHENLKVIETEPIAAHGGEK